MKLKTFFDSRSGWLARCFALLLLISAGCGDNALTLTNNESKAFANAPTDIKQQWEKALAADKAADYAAAQTLLDDLAKAPLSPDQKSALDKERADFDQRLWAAAEKHDPAAIKAVQNSRSSRSQIRGLPGK